MISLRCLAVLIVAAAAAGCSGGREPLVDRMGVSDAKYESDLKDCKNSGSWLSFSSPTADCLRGKGYKVLMGG